MIYCVVFIEVGVNVYEIVGFGWFGIMLFVLFVCFFKVYLYFILGLWFGEYIN